MDIMDQELKKLDTKALDLYDRRASDSEWLKQFSLAELILLWQNFCQITDSNKYGASYDDEVYDAIYSHKPSEQR